LEWVIRDFLNAILAAISASSLTDDEYLSATYFVQDFSIDNYNFLLGVLDARETVSSTRDRLRYYFMAKGTTVDESTPAKSKILVGAVLE
jgi:hypothetical protein